MNNQQMKNRKRGEYLPRITIKKIWELKPMFFFTHILILIAQIWLLITVIKMYS